MMNIFQISYIPPAIWCALYLYLYIVAKKEGHHMIGGAILLMWFPGMVMWLFGRFL